MGLETILLHGVPKNRVINSYYFEDKSMKDIGAEMGISGQCISQILHKGLRCLRRSEPLRQLYRENQQHKTLNAMQKYQTRPDMHLYITELEEKYIKLLHKTTA